MTRDQVVKEVVALRASGLTWPEVERKFNTPRKRLMRWLRAAGMGTPACKTFFISQELIDRYTKHEISIADIQSITGRSFYLVRGEILRRGVVLHNKYLGRPKDRKSYLTAVSNISKILDQYRGGKTLDAVSREFGIAPATVRELLLKNNVTLRQRGPTKKPVDRIGLLARRYSVPREEIERVITLSNGSCMVCGENGNLYGNHRSNDRAPLCIDHCHATGAVRGILCRRCNLVLGMVNDCRETLVKLSDYLGTTNVS